MFRFLRRENLVRQSHHSVSLPAINSPQKDDEDARTASSSDSEGEITEISKKQKMFARKSIRRDRKKQKEQQKKIENNMISMDDYLSKQAEFKIWLKEEKQKTAADMKSPKLKSYFKDFVKMWNKKKLPQKYYRGSSGTDTPPPSRNQRFTFVDGSPFPDLSGFPAPVDLSLEGVLLDSPFSTFGKCPGDPITPQSTPRILKLPDMKPPDSADKENSNDGHHYYVKNLKEPSSDKKKKKNKNKSSTPKKSKMKNDNPYKVTVLSWTSKGELSVHPASPSALNKASPLSKTDAKMDTTVPYHEVKDNLETSDYDPLYADPDPLFNPNTSVSRSKSLDTGLQLDSKRLTVADDGCKSVEELYAVPVKKKRMSNEKGIEDFNLPAVETITSPPPPALPPKRKSALDVWPYQSVQFDGHGAAPVYPVKEDGNDEFPSPPPPGQGYKMFSEAVFSPPCPRKADSPMRMAISMPDLGDTSKHEELLDEDDDEESFSSSSSESSSSDQESEEEETFEVKVKVLDPDVQDFLNGGMNPPPPPPPPDCAPDEEAAFFPPIRLSLLPPPPPELLMDTPPEEDELQGHSDAYLSHSSLIAEQGTPRSSKILDEFDSSVNWAKSATPKGLSTAKIVVETPPPLLVPISTPKLKMVRETDEDVKTNFVQELSEKTPLKSHVAITKRREISEESRRVSVGPMLIPPPMAPISKTSQSSLESESGSEKSDVTPNHDYLTDGLTDPDTSVEKDEVFSYRKALSGAMSSLKSAYASSIEDLAAEIPKRHQKMQESSHVSRSTWQQKQAEDTNVQKCEDTSTADSDSSSASLSVKPEVPKRKPPVIKPKPSKSKVTEAVELARQRQSSSDRSSVSSTSRSGSSTSEDESQKSRSSAVQKVIGQFNANSSSRSNSRSGSGSSTSSSVSEGENPLKPTSTNSLNRQPKKSIITSSSSTSSSVSEDDTSSSTSSSSNQRVLGQLNQNCLTKKLATPPPKPPRTPSSASKMGRVHVTHASPKPILKGILKTPTKGVKTLSNSLTLHEKSKPKCLPLQDKSLQSENSCSPLREKSSSKSCSKSLTNRLAQRPMSLGDMFETDIDSVVDDSSENRDPNCVAPGVRETDLDKILAEMQSSYLLSPLTSELNL